MEVTPGIWCSIHMTHHQAKNNPWNSIYGSMFPFMGQTLYMELGKHLPMHQTVVLETRGFRGQSCQELQWAYELLSQQAAPWSRAGVARPPVSGSGGMKC